MPYDVRQKTLMFGYGFLPRLGLKCFLHRWIYLIIDISFVRGSWQLVVERLVGRMGGPCDTDLQIVLLNTRSYA